MNHPGENLGRIHIESMPGLYRVPDKLRQKVEGEVSGLLSDGGLGRKLTSILTTSPDQNFLDARQLLDMKFSEAESVAAVAILDAQITQRWNEGHYILRFDADALNASAFDGLPVEPYEWLPTKIHPDSVFGGVGKLSLRFPAGLQETDLPHTHPGSRIIFSSGPGRLASPHIPGGILHLERGMAMLMPRKLVHNFSAYPEQDWTPISIHLPFVGIGKEAMTLVEEDRI